MADGVRYTLPDGATAFVDRGRRIEVVPGGEDAALLAALRLSADKFGRFTIHGSEAFRDRATRLAIVHGLAGHVVELDQPMPRRTGGLLDQARQARETLGSNDEGRERARSKGIAVASPSPSPKPAKGIRVQAEAAARHVAGNGSGPIGVKKPGDTDTPVSTPSNDWHVPDHRADLGRMALIGDLVARLERVGYLPLNSVPGVDADEHGMRQFTIDRDLGDPLDRRHDVFRTARRFEDDPAIQRVFTDNHRRAMEVAELALRGGPAAVRMKVRAGNFDDLERHRAGLAHSLHLLRKTDAMSEMIHRLEAHWREADRIEHERRARSGEAVDTRPVHGSGSNGQAKTQAGTTIVPR